MRCLRCDEEMALVWPTCTRCGWRKARGSVYRTCEHCGIWNPRESWQCSWCGLDAIHGHTGWVACPDCARNVASRSTWNSVLAPRCWSCKRAVTGFDALPEDRRAGARLGWWTRRALSAARVAALAVLVWFLWRRR